MKCERNARFGYCFRVSSRFHNEVNAIPHAYVLQVLKNGIYFTIDGSDDLRTPSAEYEQYKAEYSKAQEQLVGKIVDVAKSYIPLFHVYSSIIAQLDVLLAFAEASANAPIPYTRPDILSIDRNNSTVIY